MLFLYIWSMKQQKSNNKHIQLILSLVVILVVLSIYGSSKLNSAQPRDLLDIEEDPVIPLNHLLTNNLSDTSTTKLLDKKILQFMNQWSIKGASLAVMKDEKLIYAKGYGWADQEMEEKTEVKHIFRIASISKLITAVAIMKLHQEGLLNLNDQPFAKDGVLSKFTPEKPTDKRIYNITIEQLLRHKGGFGTRGGDPMFSLAKISKERGLKRELSAYELLEYLLSRRLSYLPGSGTSYSNVGYFILSLIIEQLSGMEYQEYITTQILHPNGIFDMHIANNYYHERYPNEVKYYEPEGEEPIPSYDGSDSLRPRCYGGNNIKLLMGAGAWVASPVELLKLISLIDGKDGVSDILTPESISIMQDASPTTLPMGWAKCLPNGSKIRSGTLSGTGALIKYTSDGFCWAFITNTGSWRGSAFPRNIEQFFGGALKGVTEWPQKDLFDVELLNELS